MFISHVLKVKWCKKKIKRKINCRHQTSPVWCFKLKLTRSSINLHSHHFHSIVYRTLEPVQDRCFRCAVREQTVQGQGSGVRSQLVTADSGLRCGCVAVTVLCQPGRSGSSPAACPRGRPPPPAGPLPRGSPPPAAVDWPPNDTVVQINSDRGTIRDKTISFNNDFTTRYIRNYYFKIWTQHFSTYLFYSFIFLYFAQFRSTLSSLLGNTVEFH